MAREHGSAKHKVSPVVRGAFLRGLEIVESRKGKTFSEMVADEIEAKGLLHVLQKVAPFIERESAVDLTSGGESLVDVLSALNQAVTRARNDTEVEKEPEPLRH